jgi:hypothetical protein
MLANLLALSLFTATSCTLVTQGSWLTSNGTRVQLRCAEWGNRSRILPTTNCLRISNDIESGLRYARSRNLLAFYRYGGRTQNYEWMETLINTTNRFKFDGVDIGAPSPGSSWGQTTDVYKDWKTAAALAYRNIKQPDVMFVVGGFCGVDLRSMANSIGPMDAFDDGKLMYSAQVLGSTFWWDRAVVQTACVMFGLATFFCFYCACVLKSYDKTDWIMRVEWFTCLASSIVMFIGGLLTIIVFIQYMTNLGCDSVAADASVFLVIMSVMVALCGALIAYYNFHIPTFSAIGCCWLGLFFASMFGISLYLISPRSYYDYLRLLSLENRPVPVWVTTNDAWFPTAVEPLELDYNLL